jgi:predicted RNA-binding Zn-ribbon protein involved in translation (DUF1610 family)
MKISIIEAETKCKNCNNIIEWRTRNPDERQKIEFFKWEDVSKNVVDCTSSFDKFVIKLKCPNCGYNNIIEQQKDEVKKSYISSFYS